MVKRREIDFTSGPLLKRIILYSLPIICVNVLQLLFTAADVAVLGIFASDQAVAAVGGNTSITTLLISFFVGLSIGTNVLVARAVGARDKEKAEKLVGTAVFASLVFGSLIMVGGIALSEQLLLWTNCDEAVIPYAIKYLRIYLLGMPIIMLYNFAASILRAVGDTVRPLIFLTIGGIVNVILNVIFVTVVGLDVEGVAIATVASNVISAVCALYVMIKNTGYAKFTRRSFKIDFASLKEILSIGLPIGISRCLTSFANVVLASAINALGDLVMAANAIAKEFDAIILEALHGVSLGNIAVISQNLGAKKPERIKSSIFLSLSITAVIGVVLGTALFFSAESLASIMTDTPLVIDLAVVRLWILGVPYVLCGIVGVIQESVRGLGYSNTALGISIFTNIILRLIYISTVYPLLYRENDPIHNYAMICLVWPGSWIIAIALGSIILVYFYKKVKKQIENEKSQINTERNEENVTN